MFERACEGARGLWGPVVLVVEHRRDAAREEVVVLVDPRRLVGLLARAHKT